MTKQIFGRDTVTGECGWFTPVADAPDVFITGLTIQGDTVTVERSDGATFPVTITNPSETDGVHLNGTIPPVIDLVAQTITYATLNDLDETAAAPLVQDISALIAALTSAPPPSVVGGSNVIVTTNAAGDWVINVPNATGDTDTYSTFELQPDGSTLVTEVDTDGNPTGNTYVIPFGGGSSVLASPGATEAAVETANPLLPDGAVVTWTDADGCARRSYKDTAGNWQHPCNLKFVSVPFTLANTISGVNNPAGVTVDLSSVVTVPDCAVAVDIYLEAYFASGNGVLGCASRVASMTGGFIEAFAAPQPNAASMQQTSIVVDLEGGTSVRHNANASGNATYRARIYVKGFWVKT